LSVARDGEVVARTQVSAPDSEFSTDGGQALLREIAARTGGEIIEDASTYAPELPLQQSAVWMWPAVAGLGVFLLELALRRLYGRSTADRSTLLSAERVETGGRIRQLSRSPEKTGVKSHARPP
jgi:hypothetical protein